MEIAKATAAKAVQDALEALPPEEVTSTTTETEPEPAAPAEPAPTEPVPAEPASVEAKLQSAFVFTKPHANTPAVRISMRRGGGGT